MITKRKPIAWLMIPPLLTILIMLITYVVKGVYPFGSGNIVYSDMTDWLVPFYARNYEIMHGSDSLLFSWLIGAGSDTTDMYPEMSLTPINWILFFIKPDDILCFMSFFLVIKLILASVFISLCLKKLYDLPLPAHIASAMLYTFSGFTLQYYVCTSYLDSMVMFPLLILALRHLYDKGNGMPYMLVLFLQLVTQAYLGIMTLMFILFYSFGYMLLIERKEKRKVFAARVGIYTFLGIALSAVTFLPCVFRWFGTTRIEQFGAGALYALFNRVYLNELDKPMKLFISFNTELAAVVALIILYRMLIKKTTLPAQLMFRFYVYVLMLFPILNESIMGLWHMGSYMGYPYRNGYMYTFAAIELIAFFLKDDKQKSQISAKLFKKRIPVILMVGIPAFISIIKLVLMDLNFIEFGIHTSTSSYYFTGITFWTGAAAYLVLLLSASEKLRDLSYLLFSLTKISITAVCFIAPLGYAWQGSGFYYNNRDKFIGDSLQIQKQLSMENDSLSRVKLLHSALANNYSCIMGFPTVAQWTNRVPAVYFNEMCCLGYITSFTANLDSGGTVFSDAFLNNKKLIVYGDVYVPDQLYTKTGQVNEYGIYDIDYTLPFGILMDDRILKLNNDTEQDNALLHQQTLSTAFCENSEALFRQLPVSETSTDEQGNSICQVHIDTDCVIYCTSDTPLFVNGEVLAKPFYDETHNSDVKFQSGLSLVGCYHSGEELTLSVNDSRYDIENNCIMLDLAVMKKICDRYKQNCASSYRAGHNSLSITADVTKNHYMYLPLEYYEGWSAKVNGADAKIYPVMNNAFMALELPEGHCEIEMRYLPKTLVYGAVISIIGAAGAVLVCMMKKKHRDPSENKAVGSLAYYAFTIVSSAALIVVYILPLVI